MLFPIIRIRDNDTGNIRIVGTDTHDTLYIDERTGGIQYLNLQNCEGTEVINDHSTYSYVGKTDEWDINPQIEFVTFDELLDIYKQHIDMSFEQERKWRDMIKDYIHKKKLEHRLYEDEGVFKRIGGPRLY